MNDLMGALYDDLYRIAARHVHSERRDHTLQATALLHEAYLKLSDSAQNEFNDRTHFLAIASRVMRQVLVDYARARRTGKRGGGDAQASGTVDSERSLQLQATGSTQPIEILNLHRSLEALARADTDLAQLIELRYFGGMTAEETAEALGRSVHVIRHDLRLAHAWLRRELDRDAK